VSPRVLFFCSQFHPTVGGAERQAEQLARALRRRGVEVEVLTPRRDPALPLREEIGGLPVHRYPIRDWSRRLGGVPGIGVPNLLGLRRATIRAAGSLLPRFDLVHAHVGSALASFASEAAARGGRPFLCKLANGGPRFDLLRLRRGSLLGPLLARGLVARTDLFLAISTEIEQDCLRAGIPPQRIRRLPNGVALPAQARPPVPEAARRLLYLGTLAPEKRDFETLFAAVDGLAGELPGLRLRLVGGGDRARVEAMLRRFPRAAACTECAGPGDPETQLAWADLLVQPSRSEGMSNALLEAMAAGVPCVASDIPPNRELLAEGEAGVLYRAGDARDLRRCLRELYASQGERKRLYEAARRRVAREYDFERVAERLEALYRELAGARRRNLGEAS